MRNVDSRTEPDQATDRSEDETGRLADNDLAWAVDAGLETIDEELDHELTDLADETAGDEPELSDEELNRLLTETPDEDAQTEAELAEAEAEAAQQRERDLKEAELAGCTRSSSSLPSPGARRRSDGAGGGECRADAGTSGAPCRVVRPGA